MLIPAFDDTTKFTTFARAMCVVLDACTTYLVLSARPVTGKRAALALPMLFSRYSIHVPVVSGYVFTLMLFVTEDTSTFALNVMEGVLLAPVIVMLPLVTAVCALNVDVIVTPTSAFALNDRIAPGVMLVLALTY